METTEKELPILQQLQAAFSDNTVRGFPAPDQAEQTNAENLADKAVLDESDFDLYVLEEKSSNRSKRND